MLGALPTTLDVNGCIYEIRTDYRDVLRIISAFAAEELSDKEKTYVCMKQLYKKLDAIPSDDFAAAYEAAISFLECGGRDDKPSPKVIDWEKDETLIFPAINKVAGIEVRAVPYMHWWTFLGYFQNIDQDGIWGAVMVIRHKKAKHRKLEKYETEFYNANRSLCDLGKPKAIGIAENENELLKIYKELMKGGEYIG